MKKVNSPTSLNEKAKIYDSPVLQSTLKQFPKILGSSKIFPRRHFPRIRWIFHELVAAFFKIVWRDFRTRTLFRRSLARAKNADGKGKTKQEIYRGRLVIICLEGSVWLRLAVPVGIEKSRAEGCLSASLRRPPPSPLAFVPGSGDAVTREGQAGTGVRSCEMRCAIRAIGLLHDFAHSSTW